MRYEVTLSPEAVEDFKDLSAAARAVVRASIKTHLRQQPASESKSRIEKLRGLSHPQHRLCVGDIRVFYDVTESAVEILAIVPKSEAASWLRRAGEQG